jgi:hypothetical protein
VADLSARSATGAWLEDDVWAATGLAPDGGVLCLPCIERRLGRQLEVTDFAVADESDREGGSWPGRRMLPQRWGEYLSRREALP